MDATIFKTGGLNVKHWLLGKKIANQNKLEPCAQIGKSVVVFNTMVVSKTHGMQPYIFKIGGAQCKM